MSDTPDESRIFIPGRLTDFEENLFLKREVKDLKLEIEAIIQKYEDLEHSYLDVVPARTHEQKMEKLKSEVSKLNKQLITERERGKILLAELDRLRTIYDMAGIVKLDKKKRKRIKQAYQ